VVAAEPVTDIDVTAAEALSTLDDDLQKAGIELGFAEKKDPVKDRLKNCGLFAKLGGPSLLPSARSGGRRLPRGAPGGVDGLGGSAVGDLNTTVVRDVVPDREDVSM
jgi:hypothetical protein